MVQNFETMFDRYLDNKISEYYKNPDIIEKCSQCKCDLYNGDECYYIDNEYYCEDCIDYKFKVVLEKPDIEGYLADLEHEDF